MAVRVNSEFRCNRARAADNFWRVGFWWIRMYWVQAEVDWRWFWLGQKRTPLETWYTSPLLA